MEGYFSIKIKFVIAVLLSVLLYVNYLYVFKKQTLSSFKIDKNCTRIEEKEGEAKANLFFERYFEEGVLRDPEWQGKLGRKKKNNQWTPLTKEYYKIEHSYNQAMLHYLEDSILLIHCMDKETELSAQLLKYKLKSELDAYRYRYHNYPINSIKGEHLNIPFILLHKHAIDDLRDAESYINRVQNVPDKIDELIGQLEVRSKKKIILPKSLFPDVLISIKSIMENKIDSPNLIVVNFNEKIEQLTIKEEKKKVLKKQMVQVFDTFFVAAYQKLYKYLIGLEKKANDEIGVWQWDAGAAFYAFKLKEQTTTSLTADEIYDLGIEEVARIHEEMKGIAKKLNYEGDLQAFFKFVKNSPRFYYPNTKEGKTAYLNKIEGVLDSIQLKLDQLFITKPNKELVVKSLKVFKKKSSLKSLYLKSILGSNSPDVYHVNTYDMNVSIEESLKKLPQFRRLEDSYVAYVEGWGMYAEYLPKEVGAYQDVYSDFGRLASELNRACHLVVDVGIHYKKWTKQDAVDYYKKNTPSQETECIKTVERHIVLPARAVTYKVGMITILELRKRAELELGTQFDLREFHDVLLTNGKVPLDVLQDLVEAYIQTKKR